MRPRCTCQLDHPLLHYLYPSKKRYADRIIHGLIPQLKRHSIRCLYREWHILGAWLAVGFLVGPTFEIGSRTPCCLDEGRPAHKTTACSAQSRIRLSTHTFGQPLAPYSSNTVKSATCALQYVTQVIQNGSPGAFNCTAEV